MSKLRSIPERKTIKNFTKFEKLNLKTSLLAEATKCDSLVHDAEIGRKELKKKKDKTKKGEVKSAFPPQFSKEEMSRLYEAKIKWRADVELH